MDAWWEEDGGAAARELASRAPETSQSQGRPSSSSRSAPSARCRRGEEDEEEGRGWWESPEERSLQAYAPKEGDLEEWQVKRLEQAFAKGRKKIKAGFLDMLCMPRSPCGLCGPLPCGCAPMPTCALHHASAPSLMCCAQLCVCQPFAQILELSNELGIDRSYVLYWMKEFALRPEA